MLEDLIDEHNQKLLSGNIKLKQYMETMHIFLNITCFELLNTGRITQSDYQNYINIYKQTLNKYIMDTSLE
jgi:hypothetical protein